MNTIPDPAGPPPAAHPRERARAELEVVQAARRAFGVLLGQVDDRELFARVCGAEWIARAEAELAVLAGRCAGEPALLALDAGRLTVWLPGADLPALHSLGDGLREAFEALEWPHGARTLRLRVRLGLATSAAAEPAFDPRLVLELLEGVAAEGLRVALEGGGEVVHTEIYGFLQRGLERREPELLAQQARRVAARSSALEAEQAARLAARPAAPPPRPSRRAVRAASDPRARTSRPGRPGWSRGLRRPARAPCLRPRRCRPLRFPLARRRTPSRRPPPTPCAPRSASGSPTPCASCCAARAGAPIRRSSASSGRWSKRGSRRSGSWHGPSSGSATGVRSTCSSAAWRSCRPPWRRPRRACSGASARRATPGSRPSTAPCRGSRRTTRASSRSSSSCSRSSSPTSRSPAHARGCPRRRENRAPGGGARAGRLAYPRGHASAANARDRWSPPVAPRAGGRSRGRRGAPRDRRGGGLVAMSPDRDARLVELETRLLFQERALEELLEASQVQARELQELRERLARLEAPPSLADGTRGPG